MIDQIVSDSEVESLSKPISSDDVLDLLKHIKGRKASGPNGLLSAKILAHFRNEGNMHSSWYFK